MNQRVLKFLLDILSVIDESEMLKTKLDFNFMNFKEDFTAIRTAERDLEIIGEALNQLKRIDPSIEIEDSKKIIGFRNLIIHSYDSVNLEIIWGIMIKSIPILKFRVLELKNSQ